MKQSSAVLFIIPTLLLLTTASVQALEVTIDRYGTITLEQNGVLGDSTEKIELKTEQAQTEPTNQASLRSATPLPTKRVTTQQEKLIRVRNSAENQNVELVDKRQPAASQPENFGANTLNLTLTAAQKKERLKKLEEARLKQEVHSKAVEQTREERKERVQEKIELHRADAASESGLYLKTKEVQARIRDGQEVVVDPETNEIGLVMPSGKIKAVNFLPDQAATRFQEFLDTATQTDESGIELSTLEDGTVAYTLPAQKTKRLFGFISRNIPTNYVLNDETGEVEEQPVTRTGIAQVFDLLSF